MFKSRILFIQRNISQFKHIAGMEKVNFSGGEPFLPDRGRYLGRLVRYCKEVLQLPSVTVVSNGSLIRESWFKDYGRLVDSYVYSFVVTAMKVMFIKLCKLAVTLYLSR